MPKPVSSQVFAWVIFGVIAATASLSLYFATWVEKTVDNGYTAEALRHPYLAAEQFLARFSVEVKARDGLDLLDNLPPREHTLLIASSRRSLSERRSQGLLQWVAGGGRLILLASEVWPDTAAGSGDRLLDDLEVQLFELTDSETLETDTADDDGVTRNLTEIALDRLEGNRLCGIPASLSQISLPDQEQDLTVSLHNRRFLVYEGDLEVSYAENAAGPQLLYLVVGEGAVVVFTTLNLWRNRIIGCHDHAHLLRWLVDDRPILWWLYNTEMPPLYRLIWQRWPMVVMLSIVLTVLWVWRSGFRITVRSTERDPARRELMEHVEGVARFLWQQGEADSLLEAMRRSVLGSLPGNSAEAEKLIAELSARTGFSVERIRWSLFGRVGKDTSSLVAAVRQLQTLRMHL
ncbi:MAG: DUF4350 domain-containing protein [Gammaproteobacteria bacterium]|nr:DUF4350 domain-containing protein [Gammaproteobacteria bacterium]